MTRPEASASTLLTKKTDLSLRMILSTIKGKIALKSAFKHHPSGIALPHQTAKWHPRWLIPLTACCLTGPP
jgi:hypothetical protein